MKQFPFTTNSTPEITVRDSCAHFKWTSSNRVVVVFWCCGVPLQKIPDVTFTQPTLHEVIVSLPVRPNVTVDKLVQNE